MTLLDDIELDLNLLHVFDVLMDERSVTGAARRLGLTQSSVSNALDRLRLSMGDRVLERQGNRMVPTRHAQDIWPGIASSLRTIRQELDRSTQFDPALMTGTMAVGLDEYSLGVIGSQLLADIRMTAPGLRLTLTAAWPSANSEGVFSGDYDILIGPVWTGFPGLIQTYLFDEDFIGLVDPAHPIARSGVTRQNYVAHPHLLYSPRGVVEANIDVSLRAEGMERRVGAAVPYLALSPQFLLGSDYVMNIGRRMGQVLSQRFGLFGFELPIASPSFRIAMLWHSRNRNSASHLWLRSRVEAAARAQP